MKIIVNDTNILIDLADIDLLDELTKLGFELHTNDLIIAEIANPEQLSKIEEIIRSSKLTVSIIKAEEYEEIASLLSKNLSFEDCSIWFYAQKTHGILLTGDGNLRKSAKSAGLEVRGIFFIFDQLIENKIIDYQTAIEKMNKLQLINTRLPQTEIENRIKDWKNKR